ncbi:MAG: hypothetical protein ACE5HW_03040 [Candidatus Methanofastidiosia archaeon]
MFLMMQDFKSESQLFSYCDEVYKEGKAPALHLYILIPMNDISPEEMAENAIRRDLQCNLYKKSHRLYQITIGIRTSTEVGYLLVDDKYWIFISDQRSVEVTRVVNSFVRKLFPILSWAYVPSKKLIQLIDDFSQDYDKILFLDGTLGSKDTTIRNWKKEPVEFSVEFLTKYEKQQKLKFTTLSFAGFIENKQVIKARIHTRGHLALYYGFFGDFYSDLVLNYIAESLNLEESFLNRERKIVKDKVEIYPLKFELEENLTIGQIETLKSKLQKMYLSAVFHTGNPSLMIQLTDFGDGSSFDFYVYKNIIEIVPLVKASPGAITKLFAFISEFFPTAKLLE